MSEVVVFGGSGFIGQHLVDKVAKYVDRVVVADIVPPRSQPSNATFEWCDVRDPISIRPDLKFDVVYLLAAIHRTPGHQPHEYYETNVNGAHNVIAWCEAGGGDTMIFTSSISVYGPSEQRKTEASVTAPTSDYGRSKLMAETLLRGWFHRNPVQRKLAIVRPAVVFGPGERGNFTRLAEALRRRRFMYAGRRDVVKGCGYVSDLVRALEFATERDERELILNYCYPDAYTIEDICRAFSKVAAYEPPRTLPPFAVGALKGLLRTVKPADRGSLSAARIAKLSESTSIVPERLLQLGFEWETDLESGLRAWQSAPPPGVFV